jgi:hypothetical protein
MGKPVKESEYLLAWLGFLATYFLSFLALRALLEAAARPFGLSAGGIDPSLVAGWLGFALGLVISYILFRVFVSLIVVRKAVARERDHEGNPVGQAPGPRSLT